MPVRIWLDDERPAPDDTWTVCRDAQRFRMEILLCAIYGERPEIISFDHDLGEGPDGYTLLKELADQHPNLYPDTIEVHSANPIGAENITKFDEWYRRMRTENP